MQPLKTDAIAGAHERSGDCSELLDAGLFVLGVGLENPIANRLLRRDIADGPEHRKAAALAIHGVLGVLER